MNMLVWALAGIFLVNVVIVLLLGLAALERRRRRDRLEIRELESIWRSPAAVAAGLGHRSSDRAWGKHEVIVAYTDGSRHGLVRTIALALAGASVVVVTVAAILGSSTPGRESASAPERFAEIGPFPPTGWSDRGPVRSVLPDDSRSVGGYQDATETGDTNETGVADVDPVSGGDGPPGTDVVVSGEEGAPVMVTANPTSSTSIRIEWATVPAATGYVVKRLDGSDPAVGSWLTIGRTEADDSMYTDKGLVAATTYYYRIAALMKDGEAPASDMVSATTASGPPATPFLTAKARKSGIILAWTDVDDETGYRIERLLGGETAWVPIGTTGIGVAEYKDEGVIPGTTYQYRVVAVGLGGESPPSNIVQLAASTIDESPPGNIDGPPPDQVEEDSANQSASTSKKPVATQRP